MKENYSNLVKNLRFYHDNLPYLQQVYLDKYLVIREQQVVGTNVTYEEALLYAEANFPSGNYLVKKCHQLVNTAEDNITINKSGIEAKAA